MSKNSYANLKIKESSTIMSLTSAILNDNKRDNNTASVNQETNSGTTTTTRITYKTQQQSVYDCTNATASAVITASTVLSNNIPTSTQPRASAIKRSANDFRFLKAIGEGSFSTVYLAQDIHTKKKYASEYII
jgi:hypothetical protein